MHGDSIFSLTSSFRTTMENEVTPQSFNIPRRNFIGRLAAAGSAFSIPAAMVTE